MIDPATGTAHAVLAVLVVLWLWTIVYVGEERQAEDDEIEPRDDNPWDSGYARESGRNL